MCFVANKEDLPGFLETSVSDMMNNLKITFL